MQSKKGTEKEKSGDADDSKKTMKRRHRRGESVGNNFSYADKAEHQAQKQQLQDDRNNKWGNFQKAFDAKQAEQAAQKQSQTNENTAHTANQEKESKLGPNDTGLFEKTPPHQQAERAKKSEGQLMLEFTQQVEAANKEYKVDFTDNSHAVVYQTDKDGKHHELYRATISKFQTLYEPNGSEQSIKAVLDTIAQRSSVNDDDIVTIDISGTDQQRLKILQIMTSDYKDNKSMKISDEAWNGFKSPKMQAKADELKAGRSADAEPPVNVPSGNTPSV